MFCVSEQNGSQRVFYQNRICILPRLFSALVVLVTALGYVVAPPIYAQSTARDRSASQQPVNLKTVFRVATQPKPLYRVSYSYEFPSQRQIYIQGVGSVSAKGSLNYLCSDEDIKFFDEPGGKLLYVAKLEHPVTLMGASAPRIPDELQFPRESRRGSWSGPGLFSEKAFAVLDKYFRAGYRTYEKDNSVFYLSTYTEVPQSDESTYVEVSVLLSQPIKSGSQPLPFTVAFTARERRSHTDWRDVLSEPSRKDAETFVDQILNALQH